MDEIAPEYDVVVLGTGQSKNPTFPIRSVSHQLLTRLIGLTECVLSGYETALPDTRETDLPP